MIDNLLVQLGPVSMNSVWEGLVEALAICGFYANSEVSSVEFSGFVDTKRFGRVNLIFVFKNTKCLDFPFVKFSDERMRGLYRKHPHVNYNGCDQGDLCYIQRGTFSFDAFDPLRMIRFVIDKIRDVLDLSKDEFAGEFTRELSAYWSDEEECAELRLVCSRESVEIFYGRDESCRRLSVLEKWYHIYHDVDFSVLEYPFTTLRGILAFGSMVLSKRERELFRRDVFSNYLKKKPFFVLFEKDGNFLGMMVSPLNGKSDNVRCLSFYRRKSNVFSRNILVEESLMLQNNRILLIGCGTLGSNLLPMLIKSGAGFSQPLTIVDSDKYGEENFSRHYLGLPSVGKNKAEEMKDAMLSQCRGMNGGVSDLKIVAITKNFEDAFGEDNELPYDIILDTTGNEAFSNYLGRRLCKMQKMPLYICGYIYGRSHAVCTSVIKDTQKACLKCIDDFAKETLLPKLPDDEYIVDSCNSVYIPFPITASISAANLMMTALFKSLQKNSSQESVFWWQECDDNVWGCMQCREIPKNIGCPSCKVS